MKQNYGKSARENSIKNRQASSGSARKHTAFVAKKHKLLNGFSQMQGNYLYDKNILTSMGSGLSSVHPVTKVKS